MAQTNGFAGLFAKILPAVEKAALITVTAGSVFKILHYTGANMLLLIGLGTLAATWYLMAFSPKQPSEDEASTPAGPKDFFSLLVSTILPKIMGIAGAVTVIGILFYLLHMPGSTQMLLIGSCSCAAATIILVLALSSGKINALPPMIWRIATAGAIGIYYLSQSSFV
ncbi:MAG: hypothetical protein U0289_07770 [Cyclobacteriaceae bacterium]|jgi:hypothetical protein|nr:hypothetical protein [Cytophagales bacterium]HNP76678.1 hypothetical protein [Cyclobacteriaceae bacterium]